MDAIRMKRGIDGGAGGIIAKSLFGEGGSFGRSFPVLASNWSITGSIGYPGELAARLYP